MLYSILCAVGVPSIILLYKDIKINSYYPHPSIKAELSVGT